MMKTKVLRLSVCLLLIAVCLLPVMGAASAAQRSDARYTNPSTGYQVMIVDESDLLTDQQEASLIERMQPITEFGDIIFWSTDVYSSSEITQAKNKRYSLYGNESSGIFAINMSARKVTFQSDGRIYSMVSRSYARSITDNVSGYASAGDYYTCAAEAYDEVYQVLQGNRIAEPMKYISFIVIGFMIAFVLVVGIVFGKHLNPLIKRNKEKVRPIGEGMLMTAPPRVVCTATKQRGWVTVLLIILRVALSSGGGGSSRGGSSGGGGGGSSGGGGGGSSSF